jgi:hypothetical protein
MQKDFQLLCLYCSSNNSNFSSLNLQNSYWDLPVNNNKGTIFDDVIRSLNMPLKSINVVSVQSNQPNIYVGLQKWYKIFQDNFVITKQPLMKDKSGEIDMNDYFDWLEETTPIIVCTVNTVLQGWSTERFIERCKYKNIDVGFAVGNDQHILGVYYFRNKDIFSRYWENYTSDRTCLSLDIGLDLTIVCEEIPLESGCAYPINNPIDYFKYLEHVELTQKQVYPPFHFQHHLTKNAPQNSFNNIIINKHDSDITVILSDKPLGASVQYKSTMSIIPVTKRTRTTPPIHLHINRSIMTDIPISDTKGGWFIGFFDPAVIKTNNIEVGLLKHTAGDVWPSHYHQHYEELNYIISGSITLSGKVYSSDSWVLFEKGVPSFPVFDSDCLILCFKIPSIPGDKVIL